MKKPPHRDPLKAPNLASRERAEQVAEYLGCSGAHQLADGTWGPCETPEQLRVLVRGGVAKLREMKKDPGSAGDPSRPRKRRRRMAQGKPRYIVSSRAQAMGGRGGMVGIDSIQAGLVSGSPISKSYRVLQVMPTDELNEEARKHNELMAKCNAEQWRYTDMNTLRVVYKHARESGADPMTKVKDYLDSLMTLDFQSTKTLKSDLDLR